MSILDRIQHIQNLITKTASRCGRNPATIALLAVSKLQPPQAIREAFAAGLCDFGENYWQEAKEKMTSLQDLAIRWHFIGPIQSNKAGLIAQHFDWVHSLCRAKIAHILSQERPRHLSPLQVCLQVNLDEEPSKAGLLPEDLKTIAGLVSQLPNLQLRGLMAIPKLLPLPEQQYQSLLRLKQLLADTNDALGLKMDTLSMGMSQDMKPAIEAGSTLLRIGQGIFGSRNI